jgi:hypothetical protein
MKLSITTVIILSVVLLLGHTTMSIAGQFTGCVTAGGTIINVAEGEEPLRPCRSNELLIHLEWNVKNPNLTQYNHIAVCNALESAGAHLDLLRAMGCPENPNTSNEPVLAIGAQSWIGLFTAPDYEWCGLKFERREDWGSLWHIAIYGTDDYTGASGGGYRAKTIQVSQTADPGPAAICMEHCQNDPQCIAASIDREMLGAKSGRLTADCDIYYHIDNTTDPFNIWCGAGDTPFESNMFSCTTRFDAQYQWFVRAFDEDECAFHVPD